MHQSSNPKRAPPRTSPPISTEEMTVIKRKVAPPKGLPPSMDGFRPKSVTSSYDDYEENWRGDGHDNKRGSVEDSHHDRHREENSRHGFDHEEYDDYRKSGHKPRRNEFENTEDRGRIRSNRGRDELGYHDDHKSDERRPSPRKKSGRNYENDDTESKDVTVRKDDNHRLARNGRDRIYNFRPTVLNANYKDLRTFVKTPCEAGVVVRCYIERSRSLGKNFLSPCYSLCADMEDGSGKELITCRKILKSKTAHYVFSMRETDLYRKREDRSRVYLGKLRSLSSSEYILFDSGSSERGRMNSPDNMDFADSDDAAADDDDVDDGCEGEESKQSNSATEDAIYKSQLCSIFYHTKTRPTVGLGMEVCVPTVASKRRPVPGDLRTDLVKCFEAIRSKGEQNELYAQKCFVMQEKKSKYDPLSSCLVDFQGRATTASVKNFQLLESTPFRLGERKLAEKANDDEIIFQMGKISKDCFNMDFMYPLNMLQAFAIAISRFDAKISW